MSNPMLLSVKSARVANLVANIGNAGNTGNVGNVGNAGTRRFRRFRLRHLKGLSALLIPALLTLPALSRSQDTWNGNVSTLWNVAANWNSGVPGSSTNALNTLGKQIDVTNDSTFNTFISNGIFNVTGGNFLGGQLNSASTVAVSNIFTVNGGGLSNLTVNPGTGNQGVRFANNGGNYISGVIFNSNVDFSTDGGAYTRLYNTNTLNGVLTMATGNGLQFQDGSAVLNIGNTGTLQGYGTLYQVYGGSALNNSGIVNANNSSGALNIQNDHFTNHNLAEATNGGVLNLYSNVAMDNFGALTANGGTVNIFNTITGESGSTFNQLNSGALRVSGAALSGTIAVNGTTGLTFLNNGGNSISSGTITGNLDFATDGGAYTRLYGANTFDNGTISLATGNGIQFQDGSTSLTIGSHGTLQGYGSLYQVYGGTTLTNNGTINANINSATLSIRNDNFTNNSLVEATNGGTLFLNSNVNMVNNGALTAADHSLVDIRNTITGNAGSTFNQQGSGTLQVYGATLNGILNITGTKGLTFLNNGGNLINTGTITGNLDLATDSGAYVRVNGVNTFDNGTISLATSNGIQLQDGNTALTIGSHGTLQGYGSLNQVYGGTTLTNNGTINTNSSGNTLSIQNDNFTNNSLAEATNGGTLFLNSNVNMVNNGALTAADHSLVDIRNTITGNAGSTFNQQGSGTLQVYGATLSGTIAVTGAKGLTFLNNGGNSISSGTITGNLDFATDSSAYLRLYGANTFDNGTISLATSNGIQLQDGNTALTIGSHGTLQGYGNLYQVYGNTTLTNNGTINTNSSGNTLSIRNDNFTNNSLAEATNGGTLFLNSNVVLTNNGALTAGNGSLVDIRNTINGGATGTMNQQGSGTLQVYGATLSGTIAVTGAKGLTFLNNGGNSISSGTITGNLDFATDSSAYLRLYGANTFDNGTISLATSNGIQLQDGNTALTIGSHGTLQGYGNLYQVYGGTTLTNNGTINANSSGNTLSIQNDNFTNTGHVNVTSSSTLAVTPNFKQTGGNTNVDGTLNASGGIVIAGGTLTGNGTVKGNTTVTTGGEVSAGHSPGELVFNGNYHSTSTGILLEELGGYTPGTQFDHIDISGALTLDSGAALDVSLVNGFRPKVGDVFDILTYGSYTGTFTVDSLDTGFVYTFQDNGSGHIGMLTVNAVAASPAVPEPGVVALLIGSTTTLLFGYRRKRK